MSATDREARSVQVLATTPLGEKGLNFPFPAYRSAMDSGIAAKATWAHLVHVGKPDGSSVQILVLYPVQPPTCVQ
jgi:hypothetical protein